MFNKGIVSIEKNIKVNADLYSIEKNMINKKAEMRSLEKPKVDTETNKNIELDKPVNKRNRKSENDRAEIESIKKEGDIDG